MAALARHQHDLTEDVLRSRDKLGSPRGLLEHWVHQNRQMLDRHAQMLAEFKAGNLFDFAIVSLIVAGVAELVPRPAAADTDSEA
mgnify:CR=1 FL=1